MRKTENLDNEPDGAAHSAQCTEEVGVKMIPNVYALAVCVLTVCAALHGRKIV